MSHPTFKNIRFSWIILFLHFKPGICFKSLCNSSCKHEKQENFALSFSCGEGALGSGTSYCITASAMPENSWSYKFSETLTLAQHFFVLIEGRKTPRGNWGQLSNCVFLSFSYFFIFKNTNTTLLYPIINLRKPESPWNSKRIPLIPAQSRKVM